jgi:hypothetical protein
MGLSGDVVSPLLRSLVHRVTVQLMLTFDAPFVAKVENGKPIGIDFENKGDVCSSEPLGLSHSTL